LKKLKTFYPQKLFGFDIQNYFLVSFVKVILRQKLKLGFYRFYFNVL